MGVFSRTNPTAAFNYVISQIASGDVTASTQALVQFEKVIRNKNHKEVSKHIDQVRIVFFTYTLCVCVTLVFRRRRFLDTKPFNSQIKFVILLTVNRTILIMLVQRI